MRTLKKILFIVLALLPVCPIIMYTCTGLMSSQRPELSELSLGSIEIVQIDDTYTLNYTAGSITQYVLDPWTASGTNYSSGFMRSSLGLLYLIERNSGIPCVNTPCLLAFIYSVYILILEVISLLMDVIAFPIRAASRILGG